MRARRDGLAITALVCVLCAAVPVSANAASFQATTDALPFVTGGGNPGVTSPLTSPSSRGVVTITGTPIMASSSSNGAASNDEQRGPDEKWGDPLSAKLVDTDRVQAGFHYYAGSGWNGSQGGVGFSLTFKN